ncbi:MAG: aminoglycoside phosphotransferase family protein [Odoribacteraceae bacterium]|jgi:Ser/Thr protein kinase RdoA (MazF antagonist)|nr:aminoglycoside phosphotransferase family protein [Odoribacteraceae bacterium]
MERDRLQKIYDAFAASGKFVSATLLESGCTGDTFRVVADEEAEYLLRRIRPRVPADVPGMIYNKEMVSGHIRNKLIRQNIRDITRKYVTHFHTYRQRPYYKDHEGDYWTLTLRIKGVKRHERAPSPEIAREIGAALGEFKQRTRDFDQCLLRDSLPGYLSLPAWQARSREAAREDETCRELAGQLRPLEEELAGWQRLADEGAFPARVTHNAFEANSVLFDWHDKPLCVLDLYMVTPGFLHHDFGDAVRSVCRPGGEARFDATLFEAFAGGFARKAGRLLSRKERETLHVSCVLMPYLQATRLLVEFLENKRPDAACRARDEIAFLRDVSRQRDFTRNCIDSF